MTVAAANPTSCPVHNDVASRWDALAYLYLLRVQTLTLLALVSLLADCVGLRAAQCSRVRQSLLCSSHDLRSLALVFSFFSFPPPPPPSLSPPSLLSSFCSPFVPPHSSARLFRHRTEEKTPLC